MSLNMSISQNNTNTNIHFSTCSWPTTEKNKHTAEKKLFYFIYIAKQNDKLYNFLKVLFSLYSIQHHSSLNPQFQKGISSNQNITKTVLHEVVRQKQHKKTTHNRLISLFVMITVTAVVSDTPSIFIPSIIIYIS